MQGLSAFRVAHCCPSFSGRSRLASPAPQQHFLLLGFQQRSIFSKCARGHVFAPASRSLQDEVASEDLPPLAEEEILVKLAEEDVSTNNVAVVEGPKVNVKFMLEKKCRFGQRFNVVGNDPLFGNWEVEAAVPMKWTEGDIWIAEVDVPAEKQVEFKFVLTGKREEEIEWQPGSNRVFSTVEGSTLVVNEAWKSADDDGLDDGVEEAGGESSDLVKDITSSDTGGLLVPADITEDATIVKALESNNGADVPKSEAETVPEIPLAELDVAATAVKIARGVDAAA